MRELVTPGWNNLFGGVEVIITIQPKSQITFHRSLPTHYTIPPLRPKIMADMTIIEKFLLNADNSHHDFDDDSMATMSLLGNFKFISLQNY